jgi:surface polysaccharide O-acyltransferase-like enzyme
LLPLVKYFFGEKNPIDFSEWTKIPGRIVFGPGWPHLWFLYMLIGLYLITPIIRLFISRARKEHIEYCLILFFLLGTCLPLYNTLNEWINGVIPWFPASDIYFLLPEVVGSGGYGGPFTGYYVAGYYFSQYVLKRKTEIAIYFLAVISIVFTVFASSAWSLYRGGPTESLFGGNLSHTMFMAFGVFLFIKRICAKINLTANAKRFLAMFSNASFGIYLIHLLVMQIVVVHLDLHILLFNPVLSIPVISIIVFFVSFICTMLIKRIPVLNKYVV